MTTLTSRNIWTRLVNADLLENLAQRIVRTRNLQATLEVRSPINNEVIGEIPRCGPADVQEAVRRARKAQATWAAKSVQERVAIIDRFHDLVLERKAAILDLMQIETGKARLHAFEELFDVLNNARYYHQVATKYLAPKLRKGLIPWVTQTTEHHVPVGVVGCITPWNYPFTLPISDCIPALLAGNAVLLKPSEQTTFTALYGIELLIESGLPSDLFQVVSGVGAEIGEAFLAQIDMLMFTGSTQTGRKLAAQAGAHLIKCSMELGGKNPMLVLEDADLQAAIEGAVQGSFANAGQLCVSFERIYVHRSLFKPFLEGFVARTQTMHLGFSFDLTIEMGPLINDAQLQKVTQHVQDALDKGAQLETGGKARPNLAPFFYEPTILTGVTPEMAVFREETFGPVVAVYPFDTEEEALHLANDTEYGLNAAVFSQDLDRAMELARQIRAGSVNINETFRATWASVDAPLGGMKASGLGRRHGLEGLLKYTDSQTIAVQRVHPIQKPNFLTSEQYTDLFTKAAKWFKWLPGIN